MLSKPKVKYIQTLGQKKLRQLEGLFIAEGPKLAEELLKAAPGNIQEVFALREWITANQNMLSGVAVQEIEESDLEKISQLTTPNKVLVVAKQFNNDTSNAVKGKITLVLDDIRDPGNMGTIIRIADWFGIEQVVCSDTCAEVYNPKVVQATMGSIARVHISYTDLSAWLRDNNEIEVFAAVLNGKDINDLEKIKEGIIIIGNEAQGISDEVLKYTQTKITIARKGQAESLNAAVAAGIILSHLS